MDGRFVGLEHTVEFDVGHLAVVHLPTRGGKFVAGEVDVHHLDVFGDIQCESLARVSSETPGPSDSWLHLPTSSRLIAVAPTSLPAYR